MSSCLPDELILEILERLPPLPQVLARASTVCRDWRRVLSDPGFLRRRPAVTMGFFHNFGESTRRFVPVHAGHGPARFSIDLHGLRTPWAFVDCRHGRVLLRHGAQNRFLVWHPMTGHRSLVLAKELNAQHGAPCEDDRFSAALLCGCHGQRAAAACHASPFRIAVLFNHRQSGNLRGSVFSSQTGRWMPTAAELPPTCVLRHVPGVAIGSTFYQPLHNYLVVAYDMEEQRLTTFEQQNDADTHVVRLFNFKAAEGSGVLGIAGVQGLVLRLWAREDDAWALRNTIDLSGILPEVTLSIRLGFGFGPYFMPPVKIAGVAEEGGPLFLWSMVGVYTLCIESMEVTKVHEDDTIAMVTVYPYTASYLPAAATLAPATNLSPSNMCA